MTQHRRIRLPRFRLPQLPWRHSHESRLPRPKPLTRPAGVLRGARVLALAAVATLVAAASVASFMESYRALYDWAHEHGLSVRWSAVWPVQIDTFIAVGELALFVALVDAWQRRSRILPWVVTLAGLAVSVAGNVGHVGWAAPIADKATAAVPAAGRRGRARGRPQRAQAGRRAPPGRGVRNYFRTGSVAVLHRRRDCGGRGADPVDRRGQPTRTERPTEQVSAHPRGGDESRRRGEGLSQRPRA